jgi:hypothetical protein
MPPQGVGERASPDPRTERRDASIYVDEALNVLNQYDSPGLLCRCWSMA